ncbi:FAD-binding oxidoreductase [Mesorhizobium huakuii]|uniref:FAD-binding oxidoreductase n=1 Tax=Mesorhizobium huakuii TaxID=28104 RepID=UPI001FD4F4F3|nr:FAD-binding oxidoreductase [Mesorhizobium huakuii]
MAKGGDINDASGLSRTPIYGVVEVSEEDHIAKALAFARANGLKVSLAAIRHSMGGHAFDDNALVLDLKKFNKVAVDAAAKTMTLQPGARWHDIQNMLHPRFAVKAMQSTDIFSVGGSLSVNAHGMDHQAGSVAGSIRSMRVMLADGSVTTCSPTENTELFRHVVGGYGLFGVVLEATLDVVDNAVYRTSREIIKSDDFPKFFAEVLEPNKDIGLFYGHLSTAPGNFLKDMIVYRYDKVAEEPPADQPAIGEPGSVGLKRVIINLAKWGSLFQELKWFTEKTLEPKFETCTVARTTAMAQGEACLVTRNNPMHDSVPYLFNDLTDETDILHEYFIPRAAYNPFITAAREDPAQPVPASAQCLCAHRPQGGCGADLRAGAGLFAGALHQPAGRCRRQCQDAGADAGADRCDDQAWRAVLPALPAALYGQGVAGVLSRTAGLPGDETTL